MSRQTLKKQVATARKKEAGDPGTDVVVEHVTALQAEVDKLREEMDEIHKAARRAARASTSRRK